MKSLKVSIIIPVYQVEQYLKQCVESVINQSYRNIEVILVDDGSTDESSMICDQYASVDDRVKVIHQENSGLSEARNSGVKVAAGDYVAFLDSDDYWDDKEALERLVKRICVSNADVLNYSYKKYIEDKEEKYPYFSDVMPMPLEYRGKTKQLEYLTTKHLYIASACNKLIRRELFDVELAFRKDVYSEDIEWCAKLMKKAQTMDFVCENFYCYRQRSTSIRYTINHKKCEDLCNNIIRCMEMAQDKDDIQKYLYRYVAFQYGTFFMVQAQSEGYPRDLIQKLEKYKWILKYHAGNKKLLCLHMSCMVLGYANTCKLIRKIYGNKQG